MFHFVTFMMLMASVLFFIQVIQFLRVIPDIIRTFSKMSRKLPYWDAKNGFAACYNKHLSICRDPVEAKKRARTEWDPLPQEEKDVINKRVKSEWAKNHPPAVPKEVDPEEKKWLLFSASFKFHIFKITGLFLLILKLVFYFIF